jgi:hypothetical protein
VRISLCPDFTVILFITEPAAASKATIKPSNAKTKTKSPASNPSKRASKQKSKAQDKGEMIFYLFLCFLNVYYSEVQAQARIETSPGGACFW